MSGASPFDWLQTLQALAVPTLLALSAVVLLLADLVLPADPHPANTGPQPIGGRRNRGPLSFRELRSSIAGLPPPTTATAGAASVSADAPHAAVPAEQPAPTVPGSWRAGLAWIAVGQLLVTLAFRLLAPADGLAAGGVFIDDAFAAYLQVGVLAAGLLAVLGLRAHAVRHFGRRQVELYVLVLSSLCGMTLLAGARDLLLLAVAFELMGIPLYVLASYAKTETGLPHAPGTLARPQRAPAEAGLKLYLVGAVSAAVTLYGLSLLFGLTGSTLVARLADAPPSPLLALGVAFVLAGFGFKLGLAPFHFWIPDTYQGAPTPVVAFLSVAPKALGLAALVRVLADGLGARAGDWLGPLLGLAVAALVVGNVFAVPQQNLKRLMGFSGVAQMGTMLLGVAALGASLAGQAPSEAAVSGLASLLFFFAAYLPANTGVFLVLEALTGPLPAADPDTPHDRDTLASLAGLHRRSPGLALAALVCVLSLAGIPFAVGFWAKLWVMVAAWQAGFAWLVVVAAAVSVLGLFYYLRVARAMYLGQATETAPVRPGGVLGTAIALCALATAGMGLWPAPWVQWATAAARVFLGR
ncbi:MAG: NADH-quinone oxidoreductase subunit N [Myxococcales bacterium]|nr:NADH-quinone oxidoreductase subunit N [Myxococcales bacterium]